MYRYIVDNAITYTQDDLVLFRESPFALWMERLTLENPDHGIPADSEYTSAPQRPEGQEDIVATLRSEGRNVAQIAWDLDEPERRTATLEAMRDGADFVVDGQLAADCRSGNSGLLMRTSGYSELGDFLYMPCETNTRNTLLSAFRLCFIADLLHSVQGQLPPQMLIIRDGAEVVPLQVDDYIHYYRAVQKRFLHAMQNFRKHRMPDPSESSHFGRWSACASEVLKQRAHSEQQRTEESGAVESDALAVQEAEDAKPENIELPQLKVAGGAAVASHYGNETRAANGRASTVLARAQDSNAVLVAQSSHIQTLAEQARMLAPGSFAYGKPPGRTPNLARYTRPRPVAEEPAVHNRRSSDAALENLEFIGSRLGTMDVDVVPLGAADEMHRQAPAARLRDTVPAEAASPSSGSRPAAALLPELEPRTPVFLPADDVPPPPPVERLRPQPGASRAPRSVIDLDSAPSPALAPVVQRAEAELERLVREDPLFSNLDPNWPYSDAQGEQRGSVPRRRAADETGFAGDLPFNPFNDSLITSDEFGDN